MKLATLLSSQTSRGLRLLAVSSLLAAAAGCSGGGGGGGGDNGDTGGAMLGDDARRAVLADLAQDVIVPALDDFAGTTGPLETAVQAFAATPTSAAARTSAQNAWATAMASFSAVELYTVGPAASSDQPGGQDLRDRIYAYPLRNVCVIDRAAFDDSAVNDATRVDAMGLGALEYLLFNTTINDNCPPDAGVDATQARADYAARIAVYVDDQAADLLTAWQPAGGNFTAQWSTAGAGSTVYAMPQDALDALSTALFYFEKDVKDRKIACPTGIGATGLVCTGNDVSRAEHPFARASTPSMRANIAAFLAAFTGASGGMGINDLLRGIERDDIANRLVAATNATLDQLDDEIDPSFEAEVEAINSSSACTNASSNATGEPAACALHGLIKRASDIFRTEVVSALSLATPDRAAGDND